MWQRAVNGSGGGGIKAAQTIMQTLADSTNPWTFTFSDLSKVDYVVVSEKYSTYKYSFDNLTSSHLYTINGNVVSFSHGTDGVTWDVVATAVELE